MSKVKLTDLQIQQRKKTNKKIFLVFIVLVIAISYISQEATPDTSKARSYTVINESSFGVDKTSFEAIISANSTDLEINAHTVIAKILAIKSMYADLTFIRVRLYKGLSQAFKDQTAYATWDKKIGWQVTTQNSKGQQTKYKMKK